MIDDSKVEEQSPFLYTSDDDALIDNGEEPTKSTRSSHHSYYNWFSGMVAILSLGFLIAGAFQRPSEARCIKAMNAWSPMLEAVEYEQSNEAHESRKLYMGQPTSEIEEAWETLWKGGSLGIPENNLPLLNKSVSEKDWHHLPPEQGGGIQAFFEGFHDLHCLNLVRQYTYRNEWNYSLNPFFASEYVPILLHVEHCLEMLRVKFMCDGDTTPYPIVNHPNRGKVVDIGTLRSCRKVSKIKGWIAEHMIIKD